MQLEEALLLQKEISNQFLFSRQPQYAMAGGLDDEASSSELVYDIFEDIFGVAIKDIQNGQTYILSNHHVLYNGSDLLIILLCNPVHWMVEMPKMQ